MNKWLSWTPPVKEKVGPNINEERSEESPLYFGMSPHPETNPKRLKLFWSILGDCIEERKEFTFQCENEEEANELTIFTWTLVFQFNDRWTVYLDSLIIIAFPPQLGEEK